MPKRRMSDGAVVTASSRPSTRKRSRAIPRRREWLEMGGHEPEDVGIHSWAASPFQEIPFHEDLAF